ncbi:MAG: hypothetical protein AVDCRST_MAG40-3334, partial [uncultured Gemmatimonadaceae bacterium]
EPVPGQRPELRPAGQPRPGLVQLPVRSARGDGDEGRHHGAV